MPVGKIGGGSSVAQSAKPELDIQLDRPHGMDADARRLEESHSAQLAGEDQVRAMLGSIRMIQEVANADGAAVAKSQAGQRLFSAVDGLGHLLNAMQPQSVADLDKLVRDVEQVLGQVDTGMRNAARATNALLERIPEDRRADIEAMSRRYMEQMKGAVGGVKSALEGLV